MRSRAAEQARRRQADREAELTLEERLAKLDSASAFAIELMMASQGIERDEAARRIRDAGAAGRQGPKCADRTTKR